MLTESGSLLESPNIIKKAHASLKELRRAFYYFKWLSFYALRATKKWPCHSKFAHANVEWCPRRDSNPHTLRNRLLKPACLPFHHLGGSTKSTVKANRQKKNNGIVF